MSASKNAGLAGRDVRNLNRSSWMKRSPNTRESVLRSADELVMDALQAACSAGLVKTGTFLKSISKRIIKNRKREKSHVALKKSAVVIVSLQFLV